jgi:hypothetical protein
VLHLVPLVTIDVIVVKEILITVLFVLMKDKDSHSVKSAQMVSMMMDTLQSVDLVLKEIHMLLNVLKIPLKHVPKKELPQIVNVSTTSFLSFLTETSKLVLLLVKDVNIIVNPVSELGNIAKYVKENKELLSQIVHAQMVSMMMVLMMLFVTFVLTDV